jgi:hypothetical protein
MRSYYMFLSNQIFLDNSATSYYCDIIRNAQQRGVLIGYYEKHHILPKSLGGTNKKENLVYLTAAEHFRAHRFLVDMVVGKNKAKMVYAFSQMANVRNKNQEYRYIPTEEEFQELKIIRNSVCKSQETRDKISKSRKGKIQVYHPTLLISKIIDPRQIDEFIILGYEKRGRPVPTERKKRIAQTNKKKGISPPKEWIGWNTGLTKDNNELVAAAAEKNTGRSAWNKGKKMEHPPHNKGKSNVELYGEHKAEELRAINQKRGKQKKEMPWCKKVMIDGVEYKSIMEARRLLNLTRLNVLRLNEMNNVDK